MIPVTDGGSDPGACGNGLKEKDITLLVALKVKDYLERVGYSVVMTRSIDKDVGSANDDATTELQARCDISNRANADIFVSIHNNSFSSESPQGAETLYCAGSVGGQKLANCIQKRLIALGGLVDRGIKTDSLYVTRHTNAVAALTELAFISNKDDALKLSDPIWQDKFARVVACGITDYFAK